VLELTARRDPEVLDAARGLAAIVLAGDEVRLARKIGEGGRLAIAHAVELAERLLASSSGKASPERTRASLVPPVASPSSPTHAPKMIASRRARS